MFTEQVDNLDKMLDELEDLARSDLPSARFFNTLVDRMRLILSAQASLLLLPLTGGDWIPIASSGTPGTGILEDVTARLREFRGNGPEVLQGSTAGEYWLASPVRPHKFDKGCLLTCLSAAIGQQTLPALIELQTAFAEVVAIRQQAELEAFVDGSWEQAQSLCLQLNATTSHEAAASLLANDLARMLEAARVSVIAITAAGKPVVQAVSGVPQANPRLATLQALQAVGTDVVRHGKPIMRQQPFSRGADGQPMPEVEADGCFANLIAMRLSPADSRDEKASRSDHRLAPRGPDTLLVVEYQSYAEMVRCATKLPHLLPSVAVAWEHHTRWLRLPRAARLLASRPRLSWRAATPLAKWAVGLTLLVFALWGMQFPTPLLIEAEGAYEPVTSRAIYASDDGFIEQLLVDDGTPVQPGQPLVQLRSPRLELQIEQTQGAARAVEEEASGIRIAINQLTADSADELSEQSRLAGKIAELETRRNSLEEQLQLLQQQRVRLLLVAPIEGRVLAKDVQRNLAGRPVRRGDALFSIVDQTGPWQIRVQVADRDVGYLLKHYAPWPENQVATANVGPPALSPASRPPGQAEIEFCLASDPDVRYQAQLKWIADHVENRHGQGCSLEVRGTVAPQAAVDARAGAGVYAFFKCGQQPLWFVWCRPLVEAAQRRLWLRSQVQESE